MFKRVAIAAHPFLPDALAIAGQIAGYLQERGIAVDWGLLHDERLIAGVSAGQYDLWFSLGGDGTMLRSGQLCGPAGIPVIGINMGRLGFLIGIQQDEWRERIEALFTEKYWLEKRMMLHAVHFRGSQELGQWDVLNEAVLSRGDVVRPVQLVTSVDGCYLTTYVADGLIASTPTGSTAYALAAGGPVLPPELRNFLIVPVAPHLSFDRAIVLAETSKVSIQIRTRHKAELSLDGQQIVSLEDGDRIEVETSKHSVRFVRIQDSDYFYRNLTSRMHSNMTNQESWYG